MTITLNYDFLFVAALVAFQQGSFSANEGGMVEVCAVSWEIAIDTAIA